MGVVAALGRGSAGATSAPPRTTPRRASPSPHSSGRRQLPPRGQEAVIGVGVLNVPFTLPAAAAKSRRGLDAPRALLPALLAVAPVMWASQDAKLPRTDAESGPMALGSLCSVATGCRASRSVKCSDETLSDACPRVTA
jgi:hypothetical protein